VGETSNTGSREQVGPSLVILKNRRLEPACAMNHKLLEASFGATDIQQDFSGFSTWLP